MEKSHVFNLRAIENERKKILAYDRQQSQLRGNNKQIEISIIHSQVDFFNCIQDGPFWGCSWIERCIKITPPHINLSHIFYNDETWQNYTLPKENPKKYTNHMTHSLNSVDISIFSLKTSKFCYIKKYRCTVHFDT